MLAPGYLCNDPIAMTFDITIANADRVCVLSQYRDGDVLMFSGIGVEILGTELLWSDDER